MQKSIAVCAMILSATVAVSVKAKDISNAQNLICAPMIAHQCIEQEKCSSGTPESVDIPQFFRIDLKKRIAIGEDASNQQRISKISNVENSEQTLILQGTQSGRAWSAVIDKATGKMVVTSSANDIAIAVFGACTKD